MKFGVEQADFQDVEISKENRGVRTFTALMSSLVRFVECIGKYFGASFDDEAITAMRAL